MVVPVDTTKIWGWYLMQFAYAHGGYAYFFIASAIVLHFVSCCYYIEANSDDFQMMLNEIDEKIDFCRKNKKNEAEDFDPILLQLNNAVLFHTKVLK